jgi:prepilin-type N-terminal cleavage/methylation domain-containing protein
MRPTHETTKERRAFTLMELLVVLVIIMILVGLVLPAIKGSILKAEQARARETISQLTGAMKSFYADNGQWPTIATTCGGSLSYSYIPTNYFNNAASITYYSFSPKDIGTSTLCSVGGVLVDPWQSPYHIVVDTTYQGYVIDPFTAGGSLTPVQQGFAIWSDGPDGQSDYSNGDGAPNNKDDLRSW